MVKSRVTFRAILYWWGVLFLLPGMLFPKEKFQKEQVQPTIANAQIVNTMLNIGNWGYWANYDGLSAYNTAKRLPGGYFPKGETRVLHTEGLLWGAILKDKTTGVALSDTPRVGGIYYRVGMQPGWINADGSPADLSDARVRIYRIRPDWRTLSKADLRADCAYLHHVDPSAVTEAMMQAVRSQYEEDWRNWPVDLGAPYVDMNGNGMYDPVLDSLGCPDGTRGDYPGIRQADQVIWLVANDLDGNKTRYLSGSAPIGLEEHLTYWTYKGANNPLSNVIFKRVELINKSGFVLDSMYVSFFSDPDIGSYYNDLAGCDSLRSLAFAYNGTDEDPEFQKFDLKPTAITYDLLQGPMIQTNDPQDTAIFDFQYRFGYKNLKMTSFSYLALGDCNGSLGTIYLTLQMYNLMRGFLLAYDLKNPAPWRFASGPRHGQITKFPLSGNPIDDPHAQYGDIDGQGVNRGPGDRQIFFSSGPFTMQPGERQDIVVALIGGLGRDRLNSLEQTWETDLIVKRLHKHLLTDMPKPPATPVARGNPFDDKIVLNWGIDSQLLQKIEQEIHGGYVFEGYTVYQLPSLDARLSDDGVKRLATFDRVDGVKSIYGYFYSPKYRRVIYAPLQYGSDSGIKHYFTVSWDSVNNRPLYRGSTYYFAITAYNYNKNYERYPSMESSPQIVAVTLQGPKPGTRYEAKPDDVLKVRQQGIADVECRVVVADPSLTTGHKYEVFFNQDNDTLSSHYGQLVWNLRDVTKNEVVLRSQEIVTLRDSSQIARPPIAYIDGLEIKVFRKHKPGIKAIVEVANGDGPLPEDQWDDAGAPFKGNNVWHSVSAPSDPNQFYISAGGGNGELSRIERSIAHADGHDFELRFTPGGGIFAWWYDFKETAATRVPFAIWDVGFGTYDNSFDDVRCLTGGYSGGETVGIFDFTCTDAALGYPATDWIYARLPLDDKGSYQAYYNDVTSNVWTYRWWGHSVEALARIVICDFGGARTLPQVGTVIRFITYKGPNDSLKYYFTAPGRIENNLALAKKDVEKINVFPNPYYAGAEWSPNGPPQGVTFNHLPAHAIIRVFALDGAMVKKMEKKDETQFYHWNLTNDKDRRIASGLYIVHIDMPELQKSKTLKLMVIMAER